MKFVKSTAMILAASALIGMPPAFAADKKKDSKAEQKGAAPAKLVLSKGFIAAYAPILKLSQKSDFTGALAGWPSVRAAIASEDDRNEAGVFAYDLGSKMKNPALRVEGIDLVLASSKTPANLRLPYMFQKGAVFYDAQDYPNAEKAMIAAYTAGYRDNDIEALIANTYSSQKRYAEAMTWLQTAVDNSKAAKKAVPIAWYAQGGNFALKMRDAKSATKWFREYLLVEKSTASWHDALATFNASGNLEALELLDVYRLMRLNNAMVSEGEYLGYAEVTDRKKYPTEILDVLQEGITKGLVKVKSQNIIEAMTEAKSFANSATSIAATSESAAKKSNNAYDALLAGESYMALRDYAKADELFALAAKNGAVRDRDGRDQVTRLQLHAALAKIYVGNFSGGKAEIAKITGGNRKAIGEYWAIYADQQIAKASPLASVK
jgi:hypothetical protein